MNTIETIYASGRIVYLILVPFLRELAGMFLAIAISKDCKARDNGSGALWGVFTLVTPLFAGVIYFIYSRLLVKRKGKTKEDKKKIKSSRKLTAFAVFVYALSVIVAIVAVITSLSSGIALAEKEDGEANINSIIYDEYYDKNGVRYENGKDVILYDKNKNKYHFI